MCILVLLLSFSTPFIRRHHEYFKAPHDAFSLAGSQPLSRRRCAISVDITTGSSRLFTTFSINSDSSRSPLSSRRRSAVLTPPRSCPFPLFSPCRFPPCLSSASSPPGGGGRGCFYRLFLHGTTLKSTVANFRTAIATTTDQGSETGQVSQTFDATSPSPATPAAGATPVPASENANAQQGEQPAAASALTG